MQIYYQEKNSHPNAGLCPSTAGFHSSPLDYLIFTPSPPEAVQLNRDDVSGLLNITWSACLRHILLARRCKIGEAKPLVLM